MSTYSAGLFTVIIATVRMFVAVALGGGFVAVGMGDAVAVGIDVEVVVGANGVEVGIPVGEGVSVGKAVGTNDVRVENGVNVAKLNKEVGVTCVPSVGKTSGLGSASEGSRDGSKEIGTTQRQQITRSNKAGIRILMTCPCWR
jgi:hypothetical protein